MDVALHGRMAIVTVCSVGIGRTIARGLAGEGVQTVEESRRAYAAQIPLGYFGAPEDMAYLVAFLCSPKARYITGERIHVDGGHHRAC